MATIKAVLRKKKNSKGLYPIAIRITKNRKASFISTGQYIEEKHWDPKTQRVKKSHSNSGRLNNFISKKLAEANDRLLGLESKKGNFTAQSITAEIKSEKTPSSFFTMADEFLLQLEKKGKFNQIKADRPRIKHFRLFLKGKDVEFEEITVSLLNRFQGYLKSQRKVSDRTVSNYMIVIRTIFNVAIREGLVEKVHYPFGRGGIIIKFPQSMKIGLNLEELKALEEIDLSDSHPQWHARNVWLTSFYFAGMRISDVLFLRWSDFKDGRLYYRMGKNNKPLSLKVPEKAQKVFDHYTESKDSSDLIFPELRKADLSDEQDIKRKIANAVKVLNKHLGRVAIKLELKKPLKTHIARHTFGGLSGDKIPIQMLQKLYRHSDVTTTINYQKSFIIKDADDALDAVLNS